MKKIGVLGTGTMGAGIVQVLAQNGYEVVVRARRESSVEKGLATVKKNFDRLVAKERMTQEQADEAFARVKGSTDINIIADADLVVIDSDFNIKYVIKNGAIKYSDNTNRRKKYE